MNIALNICLALVMGFLILWAMQACDPFSYLLNEQEKPILKGGVHP